MLRTGAQLDRFILQQAVAEGGQGAVWRAIDPSRPNESVALKLLSVPFDEQDDEFTTEVARLRREAEALRQLAHPSLVRCHGMFVDQRAQVMGLVLDWIEGQSLTTAAREQAMTETHKQWVLTHVLRALAYLHSRSVVHRDIKFGNVLVSNLFWTSPSNPETVKLVDLGVAVLIGNPDPLTRVGAVIGTSAYVPPELVMGGKDAKRNASPSGDVFAFGVFGWRLFTGQHPSGLASNANFLQFLMAYESIVAGQAQWPSAGSVDGAWGIALRACLSISPELRPADAGAVVTLLERGAQAAPTRGGDDFEEDAATVVYDANRSGAVPLLMAKQRAGRQVDEGQVTAIVPSPPIAPPAPQLPLPPPASVRGLPLPPAARPQTPSLELLPPSMQAGLSQQISALNGPVSLPQPQSLQVQMPPSAMQTPMPVPDPAQEASSKGPMIVIGVSLVVIALSGVALVVTYFMQSR